VTLSERTALASSLNVPAVRTLELVGVARLHDDLLALGLSTLTQQPDHYGAALALGGADVTLVALTNAYRALANGGAWSEARMRAGGERAPPRRVFGEGAAYVVADILSDRGARAATFGMDNPLATRVWSAAKTGTSKDMRDNWCIGFTGRFTVGVWVGNFSGAPMHDVSGITGAAPIFRELVHYLHRDAPSKAPARPSSVVAEKVAFDPPLEPPRDEAFLRGTAQPVVRATGTLDDATQPTPRIRYPAEDTVIALDPDVPMAYQRVAFVASPAIAGLRWRVDDAFLASGGARVLWAPARGRHRVTLEDETGAPLSTVSIEVR
jgi:penicillin-binding protein 1C